MAKGDMPNATAGAGMNPNVPGTMNRFTGGSMGGFPPPQQAGGSVMGSFGMGQQQPGYMGANMGMGGPTGGVGPSPGILQSIFAALHGGSQGGGNYGGGGMGMGMGGGGMMGGGYGGGMMRNPGQFGAAGSMLRPPRTRFGPSSAPATATTAEKSE